MGQKLSSEDKNLLFHERLKKLRKEAGYSYLELEKLTGISRSTLQRYETTSSTNLKVSSISALAKAYNVTVSYLLGLESRDLPSDYYWGLMNALQDVGYELNYDQKTESFSLNTEDACYPLSIEQIKNIRETTYSFLKFKILEIIQQAPTD